MDWEISLLKFLESLRGEWPDRIFQMITITGEAGLLSGLIIIIYWCINKMTGLKLGFTMLFSMVGNLFLKNIIKAPRPFESELVVPLRKHTATGYSFPSGHTQGATTFWIALIVHIKKKWLYYVGMLMIGLVALSRLYLGVHWPVDVLAAIFMGTILAIIGQNVFEKIRLLSMSKLLMGSFITGTTLLLGFDSGYTKIVGAMIGFIIGMALEEKYVSFSVKGSLKWQLLKISIGLGGLIIVATSLKAILPGLIFFDFIRYILIVIWVIAGAPYIFMQIKK